MSIYFPASGYFIMCKLLFAHLNAFYYNDLMYKKMTFTVISIFVIYLQVIVDKMRHMIFLIDLIILLHNNILSSMICIANSRVIYFIFFTFRTASSLLLYFVFIRFKTSRFSQFPVYYYLYSIVSALVFASFRY